MDNTQFIISMLAVIGGGIVAVVVLTSLAAAFSYARDMLDRSRYMRKRERKRIDELENRVKALESK